MVLQLINERVLKYPILYISGYINQNKVGYYQSLRGVSERGDWEAFILFLLRGFYLQAKASKETLFAVMDFREKFREMLPSTFSTDIVDVLFTQPIIPAAVFADKTSIHRSTATNWLQQMVELGLLSVRQEGRNVYYVNHQLLGRLSSI